MYGFPYKTAPAKWQSGAGARALQGGLPAAWLEREAPWSAERQFRFGRHIGAFNPFEEFCLTTIRNQDCN